MGDSDDASITAVAALDDRLRRGMYDFIRDARRPVTRDEAATAVGISRKLAAFHLDKLVATGLLRARFAQADGVRRVGRAPKVYEPADHDVRVTIPPRQHDLLADILLDAVINEAPGESARQAALRVARLRGVELGRRERADHGHGAEAALDLGARVLAEHGFEPCRKGAQLRLRNCPFHPLTGNSPELVCGINHAFLDGFLEGLGTSEVQAVLEPQPDECCVHLTA